MGGRDMKLNWVERVVVNNPLRVMEQKFQIRWMKKVRSLSPKARVLEIGCGRGAGSSLILHEMDPAVIHATDLDFKMIHLAKGYLSGKGEDRIFTYVTDAAALPYPDASFDAVFDFGALHHVPHWRKALGEVSRVLKTGGAFYLEELYPTLYQNFITRHLLAHPTEDRFRSRDFREALAAAGFSFLDTLELKGVGILGVLSREKLP